jgi:hypothetical protein
LVRKKAYQYYGTVECCRSGMDKYPGPRISDPRSHNSNKRGEGKFFFALPYFAATNMAKFKIISILNR